MSLADHPARASRLCGALRGEDMPKYAGGPEGPRRGIEAGARRPAGETIADLGASAAS